MKKVIKLMLGAILALCIVRMFGAPGQEYWNAVEKIFGGFAIIVVVCDYALMALLCMLSYRGIKALNRRHSRPAGTSRGSLRTARH